ncbi:hypothetical protein MIND_01113700 [Mycena indigotica]|uniref:Uncharacterized protein n=1 Tax=Mycena indigotica TaxID=2126181 RepID=A0A8H6SA05_9AGAR|nr:uncharacterized protein MIND_01113700 [Mycena indigotica]KAF7295731.1 hypothetical protein MIND_01113700 [Mycena indigotica]
MSSAGEIFSAFRGVQAQHASAPPHSNSFSTAAPHRPDDAKAIPRLDAVTMRCTWPLSSCCLLGSLASRGDRIVKLFSSTGRMSGQSDAFAPGQEPSLINGRYPRAGRQQALSSPTMLLLMHPPLLVLVALIASKPTVADTTLLGVSLSLPVPTTQVSQIVVSRSTTFIPSTVGPDGLTTYREEVVESFEALTGPTDTLVLLSTPVTVDLAFAQSSGGFVASEVLPSGATLSPGQTFVPSVSKCTFDGHGGAVCVEEDPAPPGALIPGHTTTLSGVVIPIATLSSGEVGGGATPTKSAAGKCGVNGSAWRLSIAAVITYLLM